MKFGEFFHRYRAIGIEIGNHGQPRSLNALPQVMCHLDNYDKLVSILLYTLKLRFIANKILRMLTIQCTWLSQYQSQEITKLSIKYVWTKKR